jgi:hypothetical protein
VQAVEFWNEVSERLQSVVSACIEEEEEEEEQEETHQFLLHEEQEEALLNAQVHHLVPTVPYVLTYVASTAAAKVWPLRGVPFLFCRRISISISSGSLVRGGQS